MKKLLFFSFLLISFVLSLYLLLSGNRLETVLKQSGPMR